MSRDAPVLYSGTWSPFLVALWARLQRSHHAHHVHEHDRTMSSKFSIIVTFLNTWRQYEVGVDSSPSYSCRTAASQIEPRPSGRVFGLKHPDRLVYLSPQSYCRKASVLLYTTPSLRKYICRCEVTMQEVIRNRESRRVLTYGSHHQGSLAYS